jgi:hypothetical protein
LIPIINSISVSFILVPLLYLFGFLLIPGKLTIGWHGSNWCSTYEFSAKQIQNYLLFEGFWMGIFLSLFVLCVFLLSYRFGKKLERKSRILLAISFSILFLLVGCAIANADNINLINTINNPNACRD